VEQLGEKQEFEAELTRLGFNMKTSRSTDFAKFLRPKGKQRRQRAQSRVSALPQAELGRAIVSRPREWRVRTHRRGAVRAWAKPKR
jgi:hypothetical protein